MRDDRTPPHANPPRGRSSHLTHHHHHHHHHQAYSSSPSSLSSALPFSLPYFLLKVEDCVGACTHCQRSGGGEGAGQDADPRRARRNHLQRFRKRSAATQKGKCTYGIGAAADDGHSRDGLDGKEDRAGAHALNRALGRALEELLRSTSLLFDVGFCFLASRLDRGRGRGSLFLLLLLLLLLLFYDRFCLCRKSLLSTAIDPCTRQKKLVTNDITASR